LVFQITVIDKRFLSAKVGALDESHVRAVWEALDKLLDHREATVGTSEQIPTRAEIRFIFPLHSRSQAIR